MFKKKNVPNPPEEQHVEEKGDGRDDALFEVLKKTKKARKRKLIITIVVIVAVLAAALLIGIRMLRNRVQEQFAQSGDEILSAQAERGTISTVVSGKGMLLNVDTELVSVPSGVEVTDILVAFNDTVRENDLLAGVDMATVRSAMSALQEEIDELDDQITDAEGDTVASNVKAGVPGRIKRLNVEEGTLVEDAMVEHGSLAVLSMDGYMAVDIETDVLTEGDAVSVVFSGGEEIKGTVESVVGGRATVLVTDDGPEYDAEVTVKTEAGSVAGTGRLYIHSPLAITGYAGTVARIRVKLNRKVSASTVIFTLKDTSTSASYDALLRSRSEKEETLLELLRIQRYGGITAPISGSVYSVVDLDAEDETEEEITDIITLSPDVSMSVTIDVDEADILSLELGQIAEVTVSSISDETLAGTVTEIDKTDSSGAYTAVITLDKTEGMLPGMTASVDVRIEGVDDAILIPADALNRTSTGYYVYTSYDEETQEYGGQVDVVPGLSNDDYVEIKSGLGEGDTVYYAEAEEMFGMNWQMPGMTGGGQTSGSSQRPGSGQRPDGGQMPSGGFSGGFSG